MTKINLFKIVNDIFIFEYNNSCYKNCPHDTYELDEKDDYLCFDKDKEGYYLDSKTKKLKKCFETCSKCNIGGDEKNNNCEVCKVNYTLYKNLINVTNCYKTCNHYYYFNELNNFYCTENYECPKNYKLIKNKSKCIDNCINDDIYKYEYNYTCYQECPNGTIQNDSNYLCYEQKYEENTIRNFIINNSTFIDISITIFKDERDEKIEKFREFVSDFNISENKEDIIKMKNDVQYQMTTSDNQKNNSNKNISTIDLGACETKLKTIYGIDQSLPLIIFKIDYFSPEILIPIIGYEIYHPLNKTKLDLNYCKEILIKLNIPVSIDEDELFKYDPNSDFYRDNCFSYTTENGTDIILNDRKQEFTDNKLSLCENNCNYTGYDEENKKSLCDCNIKNKMDLISEIIENPNKLSNNFESSESNSGSSNVVSIKCTKALFSKEGLKNNISSYILIIFITYFLLSIILFIKCGYPLLINDINNIINEKEKIQNQKNNNNKIITTNNTGKKKKNKKQSKNYNHPPKNII